MKEGFGQLHFDSSTVAIVVGVALSGSSYSNTVLSAEFCEAIKNEKD